MLNGLDLFSGYGGISLALSEWVRPIIYCEIERYAQGILLSRMASGDLAIAPIWDDVTTLSGSRLKGTIDIIYGGFPCQDISSAGLGKGLAGERSGLFREVVRLASEIKPTFLFLENVPAIRTRGLCVVVEELSRIGYDCRWTTYSAQEVGAPHKRDRWFLLAHANTIRRQQLRGVPSAHEEQGRSEVEYEDQADQPRDASEPSRVLSHAERIELRDQHRGSGGQNGEGETEPRYDGEARPLANPHAPGSQVGESERSDTREERASPFREGWWATEPDVGRVVNGTAFRVDRIKSLGNGVVPLQVRTAFKELMGLR